MSSPGGRQPRSERGRAAIDWEQAFAFYAALSAPSRSYAAVAAEFGVSVRTVETHGRGEGWRERLRAIEREAARATDDSVREAKVGQLQKLLKLIDASLIGYADKLRQGEVRMTPADLERLHRLWRELGAELGEQGDTEPFKPAAPPDRTPAHRRAVVEALEQCGALERLGLRRTTRTNPRPRKPR
jgi:hypothetical protein